MNKAAVIRSATAFIALVCVATIISIARASPHTFPAFDQRLFPVLLGLLAITLPLSVWHARKRPADIREVLAAYGATVALLLAESLLAPWAYSGSLRDAGLAILIVGAAYGVLLVGITRLASKRLWLASFAFLLFSGIGIDDWHRANRYHGKIHWVVEWIV